MLGIRFWLCKDGGFVCVDDARRVSAYAYPSSTNANRAKRGPGTRLLELAIEMLSPDAMRGASARLIEADYVRRAAYLEEQTGLSAE